MGTGSTVRQRGCVAKIKEKTGAAQTATAAVSSGSYSESLINDVFRRYWQTRR